MKIYILKYLMYDRDNAQDDDPTDILCVSYSRETCVETALKTQDRNSGFMYAQDNLEWFKEDEVNYLHCGYDEVDNDCRYEEYIIIEKEIKI